MTALGVGDATGDGEGDGLDLGDCIGGLEGGTGNFRRAGGGVGDGGDFALKVSNVTDLLIS